MDYRVEVVQANPGAASRTFNVIGENTQFFLEAFVYVLRDRFDLRIGIAFANDEVIGGGVVKLTQIQLYNVFALNILDSINYYFIQFLLCPAAGLS